MIQLINNSHVCCGCSACQNICPKNAIKMHVDQSGYIFPEIENSLCIECEMCIQVCPFKQVNDFSKPIKAYVAINTSSDIYNSSSGGAFISIAKEIINRNGVVFGVAWNNKMVAEHQMVSTLPDLKKLQGSKYVQSNQNLMYSKAKELLSDGIQVLYSGTPCQIAGLKNYLINDYSNLFTVDVICHGVPSEKMHTDYIKFLENKYQGKIINMNYREKSNGWSLRLRVDYIRKNQKKFKRYENNESYYYSYFMHGLTYRESCYKCPFAQVARISDMTLGDYWGIEKYHPNIKTSKGVSALLINTPKGIELTNLMNDISFNATEIDWIVSGNGQLSSPSKCDVDRRENILKTSENGGAKALASVFNISIGKRARNKLVMYIPYRLKDGIKRRKLWLHELLKNR